MIGDSLTLENLQAIKDAMDKIKIIDQSNNFVLFYNEILDRIEEHNLIRKHLDTEKK